MELTDLVVRGAKAKDKMYRLKDGDGLYLQINTNGKKHWRLRYFFNGKENMLAIGQYPTTTLGTARTKKLEAKRLLAEGTDPNTKRREEKEQAQLHATNKFQTVALEWHENNLAKWSETHAKKIMRRMDKHLFPELGDKVISDIKPMDILRILRVIEDRGHTEISHRVLQTCTIVFRYAIACGKAEYNPAADLKGALKAHKTTHYPALKPEEIPAFMRKLAIVKTSRMNQLAIYLLAHTFVRQGEMRHTQWKDIDFERKQWRVPAQLTKMRREHIVPLSHQVTAILIELKELGQGSPYLLPSQNRQKNPIMSENTINKVLKEKMGYAGKHVGHGFRAMASTALNEKGFRSDVIERQLAHAEGNKVRAAYNRAEYIDERTDMMQHWSDYLEQMEGNNERTRD